MFPVAKIKWFALLALVLLDREARGRDFSFADSVTFLGTEAAASNLTKVVFAVEFQGNQKNDSKADDWMSGGTGFFVTGKSNQVLGVTCEHVVRKALQLRIHPFVGFDTDKGYRRFPSDVLYSNRTNDIAVLSPTVPLDVIRDLTIQSLPFPVSRFDDGTSVVEGRGVLITGYPLGLGTEDDKNHPVVRLGMIAQNTGKSVFLIDGIASHGNSGSPVYSLKYKEGRLVGMVTSYVNERINLFDDSGGLLAQLPYNSGLARAVRTSVIAEAINIASEKLK
jgi:S1-C subfamily serine protease